MELIEYQRIIDRDKRILEQEIESTNKVIARYKRLAIEEHGTLKIGDIVQFEKHKYKIIADAEIQSIATPSEDVIWDLVYIGLRVKANGETYHDSQSGLKRREIWQGYINKGIATKVSA